MLRGYVKKSKPALWTTVPSARKRLEAAAATRQAAKAARLAAKRGKAALEASRRRKPRPGAFKRISPVSKKRAGQRKEYLKLRDEFLMLRCRCERCGKAAAHVHHRHGRVKNYLATDTWSALCEPCHRWVHENMDAARAEGWLCAKGGWGG